jgi:hypothetical protein
LTLNVCVAAEGVFLFAGDRFAAVEARRVGGEAATGAGGS